MQLLLLLGQQRLVLLDQVASESAIGVSLHGLLFGLILGGDGGVLGLLVGCVQEYLLHTQHVGVALLVGLAIWLLYGKLGVDGCLQHQVGFLVIKVYYLVIALPVALYELLLIIFLTLMMLLVLCLLHVHPVPFHQLVLQQPVFPLLLLQGIFSPCLGIPKQPHLGRLELQLLPEPRIVPLQGLHMLLQRAYPGLQFLLPKVQDVALAVQLLLQFYFGRVVFLDVGVELLLLLLQLLLVFLEQLLADWVRGRTWGLVGVLGKQVLVWLLR